MYNEKYLAVGVVHTWATVERQLQDVIYLCYRDQESPLRFDRNGFSFHNVSVSGSPHTERTIGIDFSPASIAYAREQARRAGLECTYIHQDIRTADYGDGYGLVMSIFGEFNVFRPVEARAILKKAYRALAPNGFLLFEPHTFEAVAKIGKQLPSWYAAEKGLFSDRPHLYLQESCWDTEDNVAIQRYYIIDAATGEVVRHSSSTQAYTNEEYRSLLAECGFGKVVVYPSLGGSAGSPEADLVGVLAQKDADIA